MKKNKDRFFEDLKNKEDINSKIKKYSQMHPGHSMLSRRDFLAAGVVPFAANIFTPHFFTMLSSSAHADERCIPPPSNLCSFITLHLQGGAAIASNLVPMNASGSLLSSYNKLGLGAANKLKIEKAFGNVPFAGNDVSKMLVGIKSKAKVSTMANTACFGVPVKMRDDTYFNRMDISGLVERSGLIGQVLPMLGTKQGPTGVGLLPSKIKPSLPVNVARLEDLNNAISATGGFKYTNSEFKQSLFSTIKKLSEYQLRNISSLNGAKVISSLVNCANQKNIDMVTRQEVKLDIRNDANMAAIWGVVASTPSSDRNLVFGTLLQARFMGLSGALGLWMSGFDYHDGTRTTSISKDLEAGEVIGKILETAAVMNEKVFLYVTTDGSCVCENSESASSPWRSDRGDAGMALVFAYDPASRPQTKNFQLGNFTDGQVADDSSVTASSPEMVAAAIFANYLEFNNRMDLFEKHLPSVYDSQKLKKALIFG